MKGAFKFAAIIALPLAVATYVGGARAAGGIGSELAAERSMVNVLRGDYNQAALRRCVDEQTRYQWPNVRDIPASRVLTVRWTWERRIATLREGTSPRAACWRSHYWAESRAGRCVSGLESHGSLRARSYPSGTYAGKWQSDRAFEWAYAPGLSRWLGRAWNWPEWGQDLMGYRGWRARGWWPWPNTAAACGLL